MDGGQGLRLTVAAGGAKGTLAKLTAAISAAGGDIVGLGCQEIKGPSGQQWEMVFKVQDLKKEQLLEAVRPLVTAVLDTRAT